MYGGFTIQSLSAHICPPSTHTIYVAICSQIHFFKNVKGKPLKHSPHWLCQDLHSCLKEELGPSGLYEQAFPCHNALDIRHTSSLTNGTHSTLYETADPVNYPASVDNIQWNSVYSHLFGPWIFSSFLSANFESRKWILVQINHLQMLDLKENLKMFNIN